MAFLFVTVFCGYLVIAFEEKETVPFGQWAWLRTVTWFAAGYGVLAAIAETAGFGAIPARMLGMPWIASAIAAFQPRLASILDLGTGSMTPAYVVLAIFVAALCRKSAAVGCRCAARPRPLHASRIAALSAR